MRRNVLITGGCGSIGTSIVQFLQARKDIDRITVFDNSEQGLFALEQELGQTAAEVDLVCGDVRNRDRLRTAMKGHDYVVHTAALKQVPMTESNPHAAVQTNVQGTRNVIEAATESDVEAVLTVSTDKAVSPASVMGASKLLAERVTIVADQRSGPRGPRFGCVRLGNVIGSDGSVVDVFTKQIENGGPLTVTDPDMTRFAMSKAEAASFITDRAINQKGGVIEAPKMESVRLSDLTEAVVEEYTGPDVSIGELDIEIVGPRPGERNHEYLVGPTEVPRTTVNDDRYTIHAPTTEINASNDLPEAGVISHNEEFISKTEIIALIENDEVAPERLVV